MPRDYHMKPTQELTDQSPMPFGQHKGEPMEKVPARYLHYLWTTGMKENKNSPVADYIRRNLAALAKEHKDGIW